MKRYIILTAFALNACAASVSGGDSTAANASDNTLHKVWQVRQISQISPPSELSIEFHRNGSFSTHGGCNHLVAHYTLNGNTLKFGKAMSTLIACADNRLMKTDNLVDSAVKQTRLYRIQNNHLELLDGQDNILLLAE